MSVRRPSCRCLYSVSPLAHSYTAVVTGPSVPKIPSASARRAVPTAGTGAAPPATTSDLTRTHSVVGHRTTPAVADTSPRDRAGCCRIAGQIMLSLDITEVQRMPDILIRDVPDDVVAAIDAKAQRAGLSRTEYLRRTLSRERTEDAAGVTVDDLARFAQTFADLDDPEVMGQAWR